MLPEHVQSTIDRAFANVRRQPSLEDDLAAIRAVHADRKERQAAERAAAEQERLEAEQAAAEQAEANELARLSTPVGIASTVNEATVALTSSTPITAETLVALGLANWVFPGTAKS